MDGTIGQNEQNRVRVASDERHHILAELAQDRLEIRGARQLDLRDRLLVSCDDVGDADDLGVLQVQVDWETVAGLLTRRNTAEAVDWERLVVIVWLDDSTHIPQSLFILVRLVMAAVMEGVGCTWIAVASGVIDRSHEADLPASAQVVNKSGWNEDVKLSERQGCSAGARDLHLPVLDLIDGALEMIEHLA